MIKVIVLPWFLLSFPLCLVVGTLLVISVCCLYPIAFVFDLWDKGTATPWGVYLGELADVIRGG